jgi:hypothetical protein
MNVKDQDDKPVKEYLNQLKPLVCEEGIKCTGEQTKAMSNKIAEIAVREGSYSQKLTDCMEETARPLTKDEVQKVINRIKK